MFSSIFLISDLLHYGRTTTLALVIFSTISFLSCEGSDNLEDLKTLEAQGVEILTCGTCLNHYGIAEKRQVGGVTNMYEIVENMTKASVVV